MSVVYCRPVQCGAKVAVSAARGKGLVFYRQPLGGVVKLKQREAKMDGPNTLGVLVMG